MQREKSHNNNIMNLRNIKKDIDYVLSAFVEDCATCVAVNPKANDNAIAALMEEGFRIIEIPCRPTAENLARMFFEELNKRGLPVIKVTVYETPQNCASYER